LIIFFNRIFGFRDLDLEPSCKLTYVAWDETAPQAIESIPSKKSEINSRTKNHASNIPTGEDLG
jgi:hypothetical protein